LEDLADEVADESFFEGTVVLEEGGNGTTRNVFQEDIKMHTVRE